MQRKAASPMPSGSPARWEAWAGWSRREGATLTHTPAYFTRHPLLPTPPLITSLQTQKMVPLCLWSTGWQGENSWLSSVSPSSSLYPFPLFPPAYLLPFLLCLLFPGNVTCFHGFNCYFYTKNFQSVWPGFLLYWFACLRFLLRCIKFNIRRHQFKWIIPPNELISSRLLLPQCSL